MCAYGRRQYILWILDNDIRHLTNDNVEWLGGFVEHNMEGVNFNGQQLLFKGALLSVAIDKCAYKCCEFLLNKGAPVDYRTHRFDRSLLFNVCVSSRNFKLVKLLVDHGVDVNAEDELSETCLLQLCETRDAYLSENDKQIFWFLVKNGARMGYIPTVRPRPYFRYIMCSYFEKKYKWVQLALVLCSVKSVHRIKQNTKLDILSMDIIRKLCFEFL